MKPIALCLVLAAITACGGKETPATTATAEPAAARTAAPASNKPAPPVAKGDEQYQPGTHYTVLPRPVAVASPGKVEIAGFFWYGCGACYNFEPQLNNYKRKLPEGMQFVAVPVMWRQQPMEVHARAFYTAKALGNGQLHEAIFGAMHVDRNPLATPKAVAELFAQYGEDKANTLKLMKSFAVSAQVAKAKSLAAGAGISGTPSLVVNGKYRVEVGPTGGLRGMLRVADYLARKELAASEGYYGR